MTDVSYGALDTVGCVVRAAFQPGDVLMNGWIIHRIERLEQGIRFAVTTSPAPSRLIIEERREGNAYHAETGSFGVWVESNAGSGDHGLDKALAEAIAARLRACEERRGAEGTSAAPRPAWPKSVLYLVPGHLGDPDDISVRALHVLTSVPVIFVESTKVDDVCALLTRFKLRATEGPGAPEIFEIDLENDPEASGALERWRAAVAAGLDTCLFGANEGIPGFCDPGKALVIAASRMPAEVELRSVGGSSVLGHALMRVPDHIDAFEFGGLLYSEADVQRLVHVPTPGRPPLVLFSQGRAVRIHLPRLLEQSGLRQGTVHLLCALTRDEEKSHSIDAAHFVPPAREALPDNLVTVVVIDPGPVVHAEAPGAE